MESYVTHASETELALHVSQVIGANCHLMSFCGLSLSYYGAKCPTSVKMMDGDMYSVIY